MLGLRRAIRPAPVSWTCSEPPTSQPSLLQRAAGILTWRRARIWAAVLCTLYVVAYAYVLLNGNPPLNASGEPIGGDYIAFHTAGRLLLSGQAPHLYEPAPVKTVQASLLGDRIPNFYDAYRNPAFFALLFLPLAPLDLLPGFIAWTLASLACLAAALWLLLQEAPELKQRWRGLLLVVCAFAPVYFGLIDGENATVSLLLYALIYRSLRHSEHGLSAGIYAALGLFKPQLFFVFPLVFVVTRRWRALAAYGITAAVLALLSLALVGQEGLAAWLRSVLAAETGNAERNAWRMASLKSFFDQLLPGQMPISLALTVVLSVVLLWLLARTWRRSPHSIHTLWPLTTLVAGLVDPHLVDYDLTVLVAAGLVATAVVARLRWWLALLYVLLMLRAQLPLGTATLQLATLLLGLLTWWTCQQLIHLRRMSEPGPPTTWTADLSPTART